jgi:pimeloyl-ACP methyl ester carboxylesterase
VASPQAIEVHTADFVTLKGVFYPAAHGKEALCVLLLHDVTSKQDGWKDLALALQARGCAVVTFDFRGHGGSTAVAPPFWNVPANQTLNAFTRLVKSGTVPQNIDVTDFPASYYPWLVNDVAALYAWLAHQNDAGEVNTANLVLIGAGQGATIGALWLNAECHRLAMLLPPNGTIPAKWTAKPEGRNVAGALWLGLEPTLHNRVVPYGRWLQTAAGTNSIPMHFVYGEKDSRGQKIAAGCLRWIKRDTSTSAGLANTAASGEALLQEKQTIEKVVGAFLDRLGTKGLKKWAKSPLDSESFYWVFSSPSQMIPAIAPGQQTFHLLPLDSLLSH